MTVTVTIQFFDGCPSWQTARERLLEAASEVGVDLDITFEQVETLDQAKRLRFAGSPTILIDGVDHFATTDAPPALTCRIYGTPTGLDGSPTPEQLATILAGTRTGPDYSRERTDPEPAPRPRQ